MNVDCSMSASGDESSDGTATTAEEEGPATRALIRRQDSLPAPEYYRQAASRRRRYNSFSYVEQHRSSKRQIGGSSDEDSVMSIDLQELQASIEPVENSVSFPNIEWNYDDDGNHQNQVATSTFQLSTRGVPVRAFTSGSSDECSGSSFFSSSDESDDSDVEAHRTLSLGQRHRGPRRLHSRTNKTLCLPALGSAEAAAAAAATTSSLEPSCLEECAARSTKKIFTMDSSEDGGGPSREADSKEVVRYALSTAISMIR